MTRDRDREIGGSGPFRLAALLSTAILTATSLRFLTLEMRVVRSRGPIGWRAPATVVSNCQPGLRPAAPFLVFLRDVRQVLPAAATVAVFGPHVREASAPLDDLIAIGQLPHNDVLPASTVMQPKVPPPRFLAVHRGVYEDERYQVAAILETGRLYELKH